MRSFIVSWQPDATLDVLRARGYLGPARAEDLDTEIDAVVMRLAALPESGARVQVRRGEWHKNLRKVILSRSPYHLYYLVDVARERLIIVALRHERQRPRRL
jgi:plasmid stabilization system protein ParE